MSRWSVNDGGGILAPQPHVSYDQTMGNSRDVRVKAVIGVLIGIGFFMIAVPVILSVLLSLCWTISYRGQSLQDFYSDALSYLNPAGLFATHLGIALLILVSIALIRFLHHIHPRWLVSVHPGMRWRYFFIGLAAAGIVINLGLWLTLWGSPLNFSVPDRWWLWVLAILAVTPLQAAGEEFFFRGYLLQAFGAISGLRWAAVGASALIFALFHGTQNLPLFVDRFGFGLLAGLLVIVTGGLEASIAIHVVNNLMSFGYAVFMGGVATVRSVTVIDWATCARDLIVYAAVAGVMWWIGSRLRLATTTPGRPEILDR